MAVQAPEAIAELFQLFGHIVGPPFAATGHLPPVWALCKAELHMIYAIARQFQALARLQSKSVLQPAFGTLYG